MRVPGSDDQLGGYCQLKLSGNSGGVRIRTWFVEPTELTDRVDESCKSKERIKKNLYFCPELLVPFNEMESSESEDWDV